MIGRFLANILDPVTKPTVLTTLYFSGSEVLLGNPQSHVLHLDPSASRLKDFNLLILRLMLTLACSNNIGETPTIV
ncbi:hypothetical protein Nepgr_009257 [Nepenthes gracilis]|uniref:Uncharacterized protein n=1 Tax=Nepenthes gracilis TaxID=150966 RepID=A0AAD3SAE0_NEPGR|nr:hypothetical protein Nepgr_009257 [Nepenthes gracilis]